MSDGVGGIFRDFREFLTNCHRTDITVEASEARHTVARVISDAIDTSSIHAGRRLTFVDI